MYTATPIFGGSSESSLYPSVWTGGEKGEVRVWQRGGSGYSCVQVLSLPSSLPSVVTLPSCYNFSRQVLVFSFMLDVFFDLQIISLAQEIPHPSEVVAISSYSFSSENMNHESIGDNFVVTACADGIGRVWSENRSNWTMTLEEYEVRVIFEVGDHRR
jgi:hypothetical protein